MYKLLKNTTIKIEDGDRGKNYPSSNDFSNFGYALFLNNKNIINNKISPENAQYISEEKYYSLGKGAINLNDIVLTTRGTLGNCLLFDTTNYLPARINSGMIIIRPGNDFIPKFLYYLFQSNFFQNQIIEMKSGSAQPQLPIKDIQNMNIPVFDKSQQQHIVNIIGSIDDLIEQKTKENILYDIFLMRYFSSIYNNSSFTTCEIKNIAEVKNGYTFKPSDYLDEATFNDNILEVLKMGHISINGGLKLNPKKDYVERNEKISKYILNENDIVLGMTDMKDKVVILGVPALIDKSNYYVLNQRVARIISNTNSIDPIILYYQMRQQEFINTLRTKANSGVQVNLTTDSIKNMIVKVPTQNEQQKIIKLIAPLVEIQKINNIEIKKLQDLKQKYLNKFFG